MKIQQNKQVNLLMVGIGGYGYWYLKSLWEDASSEKADVCGIVDPYAKYSAIYEEIENRKIPVYDTIEEFYGNDHSADLAVISSPIHFHVPQGITALKHGTNVLCDKPIGAVIQDADKFINVRDESGKWVMIGYQWSYSRAIQSLKADINAGLFGKPIQLKAICCWPRDDVYYGRNNWAGKLKDMHGNWILDSPANNACAHYLHNLFYVIGEDVHLSAQPKNVVAELYRANPIENYDTAACRIYTTNDVELLFYTTHVPMNEKGPLFHFKFEDATITYIESTKSFVAKDRKGNVKDYGSPDADHQFLKLFVAIDTVIDNSPIVCGIEAARSQLLSINGMQESVTDIVEFPESMVHRDDEQKRYWMEGLDQAFMDCYQKGILPHEADYSWAKTGKFIDLEDYKFYPGGR